MARINRYHERLAEVFPAPLRRWLGKLPPDGWIGTSRGSWESVDACAKGHEFIPQPNALVSAIGESGSVLSEVGVTLTTRRTASARLIVFTRTT